MVADDDDGFFFLGVMIQLHIVEDSGPLRGSTCW